MPEIREQIQSLIANNQTEDALKLLAQVNGDALLLQAQFNNGKKNFNLGLMNFEDWQRIQTRVGYAALEMAPRTPFVAPAGSANDLAMAKPKVFISYNQRDMFAMRTIKDVLEDNGIEVFVDIQDLGAGDNIEVFIEKALRENQFVLSVISEHSLKSGWVNRELSAALLLSRFGTKWLPVLLDKSCFNSNFYTATLEEFDQRIAELMATITQTLAKNQDTRPLNDELDRARDLQNDFGKTIQFLRSHFCVDVSGELFDTGMAKVVRAIQG